MDPMATNGRASVEGEIPGEQKLTLRQPDHRVVGGVGRSNIVQLHPEVVDEQVETLLEGDERRGQFQVSPSHSREQGVQRVQAGLDDGLPAQLVRDDGGAAKEVVSVGVVAVVMRVDQSSDGQVGYSPDGLKKGPRSCLGKAGVNNGNRVAARNESRVVEPPGAVQLDIGVDARADFLEGGRRQLVEASSGAGCCFLWHDPSHRVGGISLLQFRIRASTGMVNGVASTRAFPRSSFF